jgi:hypothetical protein
MDANKAEGNTLASAAAEEFLDHDPGTVREIGTSSDRKDMWRMGKKQELRRGFRFISIFGFIMVLMSTWEAQLKYVAELRCLD